MYGIAISLGILLSSLIAEKIAKKDGRNVETLWEGLIWAISSGIIGARIYHVVDYWNFYSQNPFLIFQVWNGGLGIFGAILGGIFGIYVYTKIKKQSFTYWIDLAALVTPIGQAVGRWGNFFNQELFGLPTKLPWGIYIKPDNRPESYVSFNLFHPLFLYESLLSLLLFWILYSTVKKKRFLLGKGFFVWGYLAGYSLIRFFLEFLRVHSWRIYGINVAQAVSVLLFFCSILAIRSMIKSKPL